MVNAVMYGIHSFGRQSLMFCKQISVEARRYNYLICELRVANVQQLVGVYERGISNKEAWNEIVKGYHDWLLPSNHKASKTVLRCGVVDLSMNSAQLRNRFHFTEDISGECCRWRNGND